MLQTQSPVTGNNPQPATSGIDRAALRVVLDKMLQSHMLPAHARESIKNRLDDKGGRWIEDIDEPGLEKFAAWLNPEIERLNERMRADAKAAADAKARPGKAKPVVEPEPAAEAWETAAGKPSPTNADFLRAIFPTLPNTLRIATCSFSGNAKKARGESWTAEMMVPGDVGDHPHGHPRS